MYATWTGATRGVADAIADEIRAGGIEVEVRSAKEVKYLNPYQAVIVGTSVHMGRIPREIRGFARRHRQALSQMPVAFFVVCLTMAEDTPEHRREALAFLEPLRSATNRDLELSAAGQLAVRDVGRYQGTH